MFYENLENQFNYKVLTNGYEASGWNFICFDEYRGSIETSLQLNIR